MKNLSTDTAEFSSIKAGDSNGLHLQDDGGNGIFIKDGGDVGIGTTNPEVKLDIRDTNDPVILLKNSVTNALAQISLIDKGSTAGAIAFRPREAGGGPETAMIIDYNGNVGIGTTNPSAKLSIHTSGATAKGLQVRTDNADADSIRTVGGGGDDDVKFIVKGSGYVGIGTTNPDYALSVESHTSQNWASRILNTNSAGGGLAISVVPVDSTNYILNCISANFSRFSVLSNGTAKTNGVNVSSDDRVKHNEQPIVGALETLGKITPKKYIKTAEMYDADHNFELDADGNPVDENGESVEHRIEAGVIAQQVLTVDELAFAVSPEDVDEDGKVTSPHSLDYNSLFTYAIAAIQEQQQIIEDLKSRIETIEQ